MRPPRRGRRGTTHDRAATPARADSAPATSDASRQIERRGPRGMHDIWNPPRAERAVIVGHAALDRHDLDRSLDELTLLADTAGAVVKGVVVQRRGRVHPGSFIGKGKLDELRDAAAHGKADVVIFNDDLSPPQVRNLEKALDRKVVDRSELILDIFARRARTRESRLQVELAQLQYQLPRLTGMWKHLERQAGGIGTRGPGETQLEVDRRRVRERIAHLRRQLQAVERERETQRRRRRAEFRAALVGYTNAGKSTLFNALTHADVFVENRLFATLDATTRQMVRTDRTLALLTDTVGFIRKLPHHLVASFHSTLVEAIEADLLLHVVDVADPDSERQIRAVEDVLDDLLETPRPTVLVFNKIDLVDDPDVLAGLRARHPGAFFVSARDGGGLDALRDHVWSLAAGRRREVGGSRRGHARATEAGGHRLHFEALIHAPRERVFRALTESNHLGRWFCDAAESDPRNGGVLRLEWSRHDRPAHPFLGAWRSVDPPRACAYGGGSLAHPNGDAGTVAFRLDHDAVDTRLQVEHLMPGSADYDSWADTYRVAWPRALARLADYLRPVETAPGHTTHTEIQ